MLRSDLGEKDADGENDEAHGEDVADYIGKNDDETIRDAEDEVVASDKKHGKWSAQKPEEHLNNSERTDFKILEPSLEQERADEHTKVVQHGDHRVLEL